MIRVADTVAWAEKDSLEFTEPWDTLLIDPAWREEPREIEGTG
jgi:hypothetical protein